MPPFSLTAYGHVPCKKNRYRIAGHDSHGNPLKRPRFFKSTGGDEDRLCLFFRQGWGGKPAISSPCGITIVVNYFGNEPDDVGVAETIYDCLQRAGVVENDRLLHLCGTPFAVERVKVPNKADERCVVLLTLP